MHLHAPNAARNVETSYRKELFFNLYIFFYFHMFLISRFPPTFDEQTETEDYYPVVNTIYTLFVGK